jgi:two-component system, OmpR family, phosphate regulon sensor histidine kinase PhoR
MAHGPVMILDVKMNDGQIEDAARSGAKNAATAPGPTRTIMSGRRALQRLYDARIIVAAAGLLVVMLVLFGDVQPWLAFAGLCLVAAAAALPRRSPAMRLAERQARDPTGLSWQRALELPVDTLDEPCFVLRADSTVKFQNRAAAEFFGEAAPETHLSGRIRSPAILGMVRQAIEEDRPTSLEHLERVPAERWFQVRCAPIRGTPARDRRGRLFLLNFHDMTEARRMDRMRTDFVANASHELRTPLASLLGFIETIQGPAQKDPEAQKRFLSIMHDQGSRMARLVDDLMSLSRLEMKAHLLPTDTVDLALVLGHVCDTLRPMARELEVELSLNAPAQMLIRGDRDELIQVFENLIENACKYGQSGKRVDVVLEPVDVGSVEVRVSDKGPGISPEHVPRLTERFYRVDIETSRAKKGTGLGLAIVKHILTRHRTRLVVQSRVGEGSTFIVRFSRLPESESSE